MPREAQYTPQQRAQRRIELAERRRIINTRVGEAFAKHDPAAYERAMRKILRNVAKERGPLPGDENG